MTTTWRYVKGYAKELPGQKDWKNICLCIFAGFRKASLKDDRQIQTHQKLRAKEGWLICHLQRAFSTCSCLHHHPLPHLSYTPCRTQHSVEETKELVQGLAAYAVMPGWSATPTLPRPSQPCFILTSGHLLLCQPPSPSFAGIQYSLTVSSWNWSGWKLVPFFLGLAFRQICPENWLAVQSPENYCQRQEEAVRSQQLTLKALL